jgi:TIR domain/Mind bomb SH3 repeat domain
MKVFISHSAQDKWIARKLSEELEGLGATTFLDEKDITTGESIDDSIQAHLSECDDLLMLLSPAALASHWVMLEIGGAKALGKLLVPILLNVDLNELPPPVAKGLARDLNDVGIYFNEVQSRIREQASMPPGASVTGALGDSTKIDREAQAVSAKAEAESRRRRTFEVGDLVRIPDRPQEVYVTDRNQRVRWNDDMTQHVGKTATVVYADDDRTVNLDVAPRNWWAMDWLEAAGA